MIYGILGILIFYVIRCGLCVYLNTKLADAASEDIEGDKDWTWYKQFNVFYFVFNLLTWGIWTPHQAIVRCKQQQLRNIKT